MRDSGLAHILSISGVHMAIVGGFVFARAAAADRRLAVAGAARRRARRWRRRAALIAVWRYLVLSGAPPPAMRSALTAGIAFVAMLLDRRAISLHSLAIAALVVLLVQPEAVAQPGFQMSFAATAALVALAEVWPHAVRPEVSAPGRSGCCRRRADWLVGGRGGEPRGGPGDRPLRHPALQPGRPVGLARQLCGGAAAARSWSCRRWRSARWRSCSAWAAPFLCGGRLGRWTGSP